MAMRGGLTFPALGLMVAMTACSKPGTVQPPTSPRPADATAAEARQAFTNAIDACSLLTRQEIEAIQGGSVTEAKSSAKSEAGFTVSQCYFLLSTAADSVVLTVTQRVNNPDTREPKELWEDIFHRDGDKPEARDEKESNAPPPERIGDLGDEAFWVSPGVGGALYALKANTYIRISIGGAGDQAAKIQKSKALAEIVLSRL